MTETPAAYLPTDRRQALLAGVDLPVRTTGAALFADISGFTPLSETLATAFGRQRGAEELSIHLNQIYDALVEQVDAYRGSVLVFSGDAITCWFDTSGDGGWVDKVSDSSFGGPTQPAARPSPAQRATASALAMQEAMQRFAVISIAGSFEVSLAIKVAVAVGPVVRYVVGDPEIQLIDVLAGETLQTLARAEHLAERGDVLLTEEAVRELGNDAVVAEWRAEGNTERFAVVTALASGAPNSDPWPALDSNDALDALIRPWLLPPVAAQLSAGMGEYLTELRPCVALFMRFGGIDYDGDPDAGLRLNSFVRAVQATLAHFEAYLLQLTVGDKGSYLYTAFGAPIAHEDDAVRAVTAALRLRDYMPRAIADVKIGVAQGRLRTGAYGATSRRTYGVLGDEVNLAARLMQHAPSDGVLVDDPVRRATQDSFVWAEVEPITVKGKSQSVQASLLLTATDRRTTHLAEPSYGFSMIGRVVELALGEAKLDLALRGNGQVLGVTGEAGMGKSRLIAVLIASARERSIVGYGGECQAYGVNSSFLVWHNIFRGFFGLDGTMSNAEQIAALHRQLTEINPALLSRLPLLGAVVNISIPDSELTAAFDAKLRKESLESLLVECVRHRSQRHPILFVLEDCHWLDPLSHALLEVLARATTDRAVMIAMAFRATHAPWLSEPRLTRLAQYTAIALGDLPDADVALLVDSKLTQLYGDDADAPARMADVSEFVADLTRRAQGNPFYVEQFLNFLHDQGVDPFQAGAVDNLQLPDTLHSLILGRIDQLGEDQRTILKVASVIGRLFEVAMLWGVHQRFSSHDRLLTELATLADLELTQLERPEPELTYLFKHVLTQEVAYGTLPFATRASLHEQIGQYVESRHPDFIDQHVDLLAYHYEQSANTEKKRVYLRRAGSAAAAGYDNVSAIGYFQRVLPLLDGAERVEVLLALAAVQEVAGDWANAEMSAEEARTIAHQRGEAGSRALAEATLGVISRKRGRFDEATAWFSSARSSFDAVGDIGGVCRAASEVGEVLQLQGHFPEARARFDESLALVEHVADPDVRHSIQARALKAAAAVAVWQGDLDRAEELNVQSLALRRELGDTPGVAVVLTNQGVVARFRNDLHAARRLNDESIDLFRVLGDRWSLGQLLNNQACIAADQGEYSEARTLLHESLDIRRQLGDRPGLALSLNTLADVLIDEGEYGGASPLLDESLALYREQGNDAGLLYVLEDYAAIASWLGDHERALRLIAFAEYRRELLGMPLPQAERERANRLVAPSRAAVDPVAAEVALTRGRALAQANALDEIL